METRDWSLFTFTLTFRLFNKMGSCLNPGVHNKCLSWFLKARLLLSKVNSFSFLLSKPV